MNVRSLSRVLLGSVLLVTAACSQKQSTGGQNSKTQLNAKAASYNTQLGVGYLNQGNIERAKKKLLLAVSQAPDSAEVNGAMAYFMERTGEMKHADAYYRRAIKLSPQGGAQLNNYGTYLCRQGLFKQSLAYFLRAARDPRYVKTAAAYENAGLCAMSIPDKALAKSYFEKAIQHDPQRSQSLRQLAVLSYELKQYPQTLGYAEILEKNKQLSEKITEYAYLASKSLNDANNMSHYKVLLQTKFSSSKNNPSLLAREQSHDEPNSRIS